jgi:hypothetical protein
MKRAGLVCGLSAAVLFVTLAAAQPRPDGPERTQVAPPPPPAAIAPAPPPPGVDVLMDRLAAIKAQKAQLEKQEQETVALLREKLKQQKLRLQKLGVEPQEAAPQPAPVVVDTPAPASAAR